MLAAFDVHIVCPEDGTTPIFGGHVLFVDIEASLIDHSASRAMLLPAEEVKAFCAFLSLGSLSRSPIWVAIRLHAPLLLNKQLQRQIILPFATVRAFTAVAEVTIIWGGERELGKQGQNGHHTAFEMGTC